MYGTQRLLSDFSRAGRGGEKMGHGKERTNCSSSACRASYYSPPQCPHARMASPQCNMYSRRSMDKLSYSEQTQGPKHQRGQLTAIQPTCSPEHLQVSFTLTISKHLIVSGNKTISRYPLQHDSSFSYPTFASLPLAPSGRHRLTR